MKVKKTGQCSNLLYGKNKGFVFTIDALIAVIIAVTAIAAASFYIGASSGEPITGLQMLRTGYDLLNIINQKGLWTSQASIEAELSSLLPSNYAMIIKEQCSGGWNDMAKGNTGSFDLPANKEVLAGENVIVKGSEYCRVRFYLWLK